MAMWGINISNYKKQNVDNVDNKKVEHIFCATCLVYHKVGGMAEEKTFYLDRQGGGVLQLAP